MSIYACSDLHGMGDLWDQIKEYLKPEDTLYFLGDAIDRGPDGWRIVKEMLADPRVIYLKGNHEDMMVKALRTSGFGHYRSEDMDIWDWNGNDPTYCAFRNDPDKDIIDKLENLPFIAVYHNYTNMNIILCHAGCNPKAVDILTEEDALWDRYHYFDYKVVIPRDTIIIHGHTPVLFLEKTLKNLEESHYLSLYRVNYYGALVYHGGQKIDLDCASAFTGKTVLLNLNTFEFIPFTTTKGLVTE